MLWMTAVLSATVSAAMAEVTLDFNVASNYTAATRLRAESSLVFDFSVDGSGNVVLDASTTSTDPAVTDTVNSWDGAVGTVADASLFNTAFTLTADGFRAGYPTAISFDGRDTGTLGIFGQNASRIDGATLATPALEELVWTLTTSGNLRVSFKSFVYGNAANSSGDATLFSGEVANTFMNMSGTTGRQDISGFSIINGQMMTFTQPADGSHGFGLAGFTFDIVGISEAQVIASNPSPPNGDIIVTSPDDVVLGWTAGISAVSHDVYFGTHFDDVKNGTGGTFRGRVSLDANSFNPGDLEFDRTYYWRIDEVKGFNTWSGDVWTFETAVEFGSRVNRNTLTGKMMAGYQGWFNCPTDGAGLGWTHWKEADSQKFEPGHCSIDMWPDMSEYDDDEKFATPFEHADGSTAYVFSSYNRKTVMRHWKWMYDYGIDGGFVQRFASGTKNSRKVRHNNAVLSHCLAGAKRYGRTYALMYDLGGLGYGEIETVLIEDFKKLVDQTDLLNSDAYLHHNGRPLVAVWGMGFKDRAYTPAECDELVVFLKDDPTYGGCSVMLGVPSYWRTLTRDCISDPIIHDVILKADIISPWAVGRFGMSGLYNYDSDVWEPDMAWCSANNLDYLPVVWPGFSWYNLNHADAPFESHPRYGGQFLWKQLIEAKRSGATMLYQAMFDEVDESTAVFKCTNNPPVGESPFLADTNWPTDHYLWLSAQGGRLLRGEIEPTNEMPMTRYQAANPNPADSSTNVSPTANLSWTAGSYVDSHNLYFGTSTPPPFIANLPLDVNSYEPGTMAENTTYYWCIDEVKPNGGTTTGKVWSFTTAQPTQIPTPTPSTEDFETGDFSKFDWISYGDGGSDTEWSITSDERHFGDNSATAGHILDSQESSLSVTLDCVDGNISFFRKVSSEGDYDYLSFYIDGSQRDRWSGDEDWARESYPVGEGRRTFEWVYSKDGSASDGYDTAWIDDIVFPIE